MNHVRPLRVALLANAAFSLMSAGFMVLKPGIVGEMLGIQAPLVLQGIGAALGVFAADLILQATRDRIAPWRALYASAADFVWVLATLGLLIGFPDALSGSGKVLVGAVALVVLGLGAWQLWAIDYVYRLPATGEYRVCISVQVNVSADAMWSVISRLGNIENYAPALAHSAVLDGKAPGVGAVRLCENRVGKRWREECVGFVAGRSVVLRFVAEAPDFPFPIQRMTGGWEIMPSDRGSQVTVWWELMPKPKSFAFVILPLLAFQADRDLPQIIQRMAADALEDAADSTRLEVPGAIARLLPNFC
ncbi:MAG: SRPBCC family protein [Leptolyngbya sp. SIO1E4]|nr:SRPBCC family protein [Leptolyngbya sp. SIO1E4]